MRFQVITLRVPFDPDVHTVPSLWDWDRTCGLGYEPKVEMLNADPVSEDPDVQAIEPLPDHPIDDLLEPDDYWESHADFPVSDWQHEVGDSDTRLGYHAWLERRISDAHHGGTA